MRINAILFCVSVLFSLMITSCNGKEEIEKWPEKGNYYDPSKPIAMESMSPNWGRINNDFVITGNFPLDLSKIKVFFGDVEAVLVNCDGRDLYGLVPKQPAGVKEITMEVDGQTYTLDNFTFKYYLTESVTTVVGKFGEVDPHVTGTLDEARLNSTSDLAAVSGQDGDNLIVSCGGWADKIYLVSFDDNTMVQLTGIGYMGSVATNNSRDGVAIVSRGDGTIYTAKRSDGWTLNVTGITFPFNGGNNQGNLSFAEDDRYLYVMATDGLYRVDLENRTCDLMFNVSQFPAEYSGVDTSQWRHYLTYSKYDKAFFASYPDNNAIFKIWEEADGTWKVERYAGFKASWEGNNVTGDRLNDAVLKNPCGMCVNSKGELYVVLQGAHCIVKIVGREVSLVAGHANQSGRVNGTPTEAYFDSPLCIALDVDENFFIGEDNTGVIRKMTIE